MVANASRTALVIGITGAFGGAVATALSAHGWKLRALHRAPKQLLGKTSIPPGVEWLAGDAMDQATVVAAAKDADLILHGANPPRYRNWRELAIPMLANSIAAASASGARVIFPGNLYNFGPDAWPLVDEQSPQHPNTRKGAIRVKMERMLLSATDEGTRVLIVRAGDFFGPGAISSWFGAAMVKPGQVPRSVVYPGLPETGHAWAYLPDLTETVARLADIEATLPEFSVFHFGGHWLEPGIDMARAIGRAVDKPDIHIRSVPWLLLNLAAPFSSFLRELIEMRYLWRTPVRPDNRKLRAQIGDEPHTPLEEAVMLTLRSLNCLPG